MAILVGALRLIAGALCIWHCYKLLYGEKDVLHAALSGGYAAVLISLHDVG